MAVHSVKWTSSRESRETREAGQRKVVHSSCQVNIIYLLFNTYIHNNFIYQFSLEILTNMFLDWIQLNFLLTDFVVVNLKLICYYYYY